VGVPVQDGLTVSGAALGASSNALSPVPHPSDPGFVVTHPVATTLPDGNLYVLWQALPQDESGGSSPSGVRNLALHGAYFYPSNDSWGPVRVWSSTGIAQSYALDPSGAGRLVELLSSQLLPTQSSAETLTAYNLSSGAVLSSAPVEGFSDVVSVRSSPGLLLLRDLEGNYSLLEGTPGSGFGSPASLGYSPGAGEHLVGAEFVPGSASTLLLHYRGPYGGSLVLLDAADSATLGTLPLVGNVTDVEALYSGGAYFVYAATPMGYLGWKWVGGTWSPLSTVASNGAQEFGLSQVGGALLLYAVAPVGNGSSAPQTLFLAEIPEGLPLAAPPPAGSSPSSSGSGGSSSAGANYALYLAIAAVAVAVLLIALAVIRGRSRPAPNPPTSPAPPPPPPGA
jgi:hypothetical protein